MLKWVASQAKTTIQRSFPNKSNSNNPAQLNLCKRKLSIHILTPNAPLTPQINKNKDGIVEYVFSSVKYKTQVATHTADICRYSRLHQHENVTLLQHTMWTVTDISSMLSGGFIRTRRADRRTWDSGEYYKAKNKTEERFNRWASLIPAGIRKTRNQKKSGPKTIKLNRKKILVFIFFVSVFPFDSYIPSPAVLSSLLTFLENINQHSRVSVTAVKSPRTDSVKHTEMMNIRP